MANFGTNCHKLGATFSGKTINESYICVGGSRVRSVCGGLSLDLAGLEDIFDLGGALS